MKISPKFKVFIYVVMNIGILIWYGIIALQNVSPRNGLIILLASAVWMNVLLWFLFRMREKNQDESQH